MTVKIITGDCRDVLRTLPDESVHCVVTSPPYWGLRDYGTATWEGGDEGCDHDQRRRESDPHSKEGEYGGKARDSLAGANICRKCGARRIDSQLGLEPSPAEYVERMVEVSREVRRVLRDDGTLWLNLGDSYNAAGREGHGTKIGAKQGTNRASATAEDWNRPTDPLLKPKDLVGIPWRVAFALQADGWYLRQDIIWSKPNPMPESVKDRCTKAHEYLFLLSKRERYYFDQGAIRERGESDRPDMRLKGVRTGLGYLQDGAAPSNSTSNCKRRTPRSAELNTNGVDTPTRNRRSVWTATTQPFSEAHFATFPPARIEPCIMAGCPKGGTVLDPFGGAGTTGLVADRLGRNATLIELNPEYAAMARRRIRCDAPILAQIEAVA